MTVIFEPPVAQAAPRADGLVVGGPAGSVDSWPARDELLDAFQRTTSASASTLASAMISELGGVGRWHGPGLQHREVVLPEPVVALLERWLLERILCATDTMTDRLFVDRSGAPLEPAAIVVLLARRRQLAGPS